MAVSIALSACSGLDTPQPATTEPPPTVPVPPTRPEPQPLQTLPLATLPPGADVCDAFSEVEVVGSLGDPVLEEVSGIVSSRRYPQVFWAHNDSRGGATVYAVNTDGTLLATWQLADIVALDWEDIAAGPGPVPDVTYLYVGDIGDNFALRSEILVHRFPEPDVAESGVVTDVETFRLSYPEPGANAEAMTVDPATGDILIFTKNRDGPEMVWRAPGDELRDGMATRLEPVAELHIGEGVEVTAADMTLEGDRIALRGYDRIWIWPRLERDLASTFAARPCTAASPDEVQGEALAFDAAAINIYTTSEGTGAPIHRVAVDR